MTKRIRIYNPGGAGWQTTITDVETGEEILNVSQIEVLISTQGMPTATVYTFIAPEVNLTVFAEQKNVCPCCKQVIQNAATQSQQ